MKKISKIVKCPKCNHSFIPPKGKNVDTEVIEVNITDEDFLFLARKAHERDITLNDLICEMLLEYSKKIVKCG